MDSVSTSSELISKTGSLADSDIRDVDLDSAYVEAHSQVVEVSVHQGTVQATSAIDAGQAPTMDNLVLAPQCAMLLRSMHAPPVGSTSNRLQLAHITSAAAPLLINKRPSFPPGTRATIGMLPGAPVVFSGVPGALPAPCRVPGHRITTYGRSAVA